VNYEDMTPGELLAEANVAEFVKDLALGIAEAQRELDKNSIEQAILLANTTLPGTQRSLLEMGFSPVFYHFQYADIEVSMHLKLAVETSLSIGGSLGVDFESSESSTSESTGTATITLLNGTATPAMAMVRLSKPAAATLVVGGSTIVIDTPAMSPDVVVVANHVHATAQTLANHLISSSVPEITNATTRLYPNGAFTPTTGCPSVFVCKPNRIGVNAVVLGSAYEWVEILQVAYGKMKLLGTDDEASWSGGLDLSATANAMVTGVTTEGYDASLIVDKGKAICVPHFDFNQSIVKPADFTDLDALAMWLSNDVSVGSIVLEGYADLTGGNTPYNLALSDARAEAVKSYLFGRGVDPLKITVIPRGATNSLGTGNDADDRRVEISFPGGPKNVVAIQKTPGGTWSTLPFTPASVGKVLANLDAVGSPCSADDTWVTVKGKKYENGTGPQKFTYDAANPISTAASLATAISSDTSTGGAFAFVDPPDSSQIALISEDAYVEIRMVTTAQSAAANATTLTTGGALSIGTIFDGGSDLAFVTQNDQVVLAGTAYTAVNGTPGPDQFKIGPMNTDTATNLASAINASQGFTAVAAGGVVTITGPAGSLVSTTNPSAFKLSDDKLSGSAMQPVETNRSVAVAASFDARYSKQFGLEMEGNSRISARLVAIPAPPELLAEIKKYLT
jgi:flagellar motor protein MotB